MRLTPTTQGHAQRRKAPRQNRAARRVRGREGPHRHHQLLQRSDEARGGDHADRHAIADAKSGKETLQFEKKGDSLVSKTKLPEGEGYNVVVQFKQTAEAKPQNIRFKLDLNTCGECKRAEYACACEH